MAVYFTGPFFISSIFVVLGFGLVFAYFKTSTLSSVFLSLFIVSFTILLSPILQKFWFNIFIYGFGGQVINPLIGAGNAILFTFESGLNIFINYYVLKISLINAISQLVMFTALIGRLNTLQIMIISIFYNLLWNLCHFLCISIQQGSPDYRVFDDFAVSNVYLFAGCFGLILSLLLKNPPATDEQYGQNQSSAIIAYMGTFFIFMSFCATSTLFSTKVTNVTSIRRFFWPESILNMFFALSASVISTYSFSILFGKDYKIGIR